MPGTIVIIDDDQSSVDLLETTLNKKDYQTFTAENGVKGLELVRRVLPDLVILEMELPDLRGFSVCKQIRADKQTRSIAMIILSIKCEEIDRVSGLEMGADDYLVKPFSPREMVARVEAVLRRCGKSNGSDDGNEKIPEIIEFGEIRMDIRQYLVTVRGKEVKLTVKEFDLLKLFLSNPEQVFTREYLLEAIWGYEYSGGNRTVDVHIRRLRKRIEINPDEPLYLETVYRMGYRLRNPPSAMPKLDKKH